MNKLSDYLNAINHKKTNIMDTDDEQIEKKYPAFIVNKCLAPFQETIMLVNEMNMNHHLPNKLQFDFLLNSIRARKRFTPWMKASKQKNLQYVKEFYGYGNEKAKSALKLLNDEQITAIKNSLEKGGRNGRD